MSRLGLSIEQIMLLGSIGLVFYFFMLRPQLRRQKEQSNFLEKMKKGDQVVTIGGIHGKIHEIRDDLVTLEIDHKGNKLSVSKNAISIESTVRYYQSKRKSAS